MKQKRLRKQLGTGYFFEQRLSAAVVANLLETLDGSNHFLIAASLAVGAVKLEAVVYWNNGKYSLGYDLLVKDTPLSPDWICYENLPDPVRYNAWNLEREMFLVLDRAVDKYGLSYMRNTSLVRSTISEMVSVLTGKRDWNTWRDLLLMAICMRKICCG